MDLRFTEQNHGQRPGNAHLHTVAGQRPGNAQKGPGNAGQRRERPTFTAQSRGRRPGNAGNGAGNIPPIPPGALPAPRGERFEAPPPRSNAPHPGYPTPPRSRSGPDVERRCQRPGDRLPVVNVPLADEPAVEQQPAPAPTAASTAARSTPSTSRRRSGGRSNEREATPRAKDRSFSRLRDGLAM